MGWIRDQIGSLMGSGSSPSTGMPTVPPGGYADPGAGLPGASAGTGTPGVTPASFTTGAGGGLNTAQQQRASYLISQGMSPDEAYILSMTQPQMNPTVLALAGAAPVASEVLKMTLDPQYEFGHPATPVTPSVRAPGPLPIQGGATPDALGKDQLIMSLL